MKVAVQGDVTWTQASNSVTIEGGTRLIVTNDLPRGLPTGSFPIAPSDPAYHYDHYDHYDATLEYPYTLGCFHGTRAAGGPPGG